MTSLNRGVEGMTSLIQQEAQLFDYEGQQLRRKRIFGAFAAGHGAMFSPEGEYTGPNLGHTPRPNDLMGHCVNYLGSGNPDAVRTANAVLWRLPMIECHFLPNRSLWLLRTCPHLLEKDVRKKLEEYSRSHLDGFAGEDQDFVGVNDNFPCVSAYTLMAGGLRFGRPELYERGCVRLRQLKEMLNRRGAASEYASPTYSLLQLHALAQLGELTAETDPEMHRLVLDCEARIWADYLAHYYLPADRLAGPYSRSYTSTLVEWTTHPAALYLLFGDSVPGGLPEEEREALMVRHNHHILAADFHCPPLLREWLAGRQYPFSYEATTEFHASSDEVIGVQKLWSDPDAGPGDEGAVLEEYASGSGRVSTYMTEAYSLGVASREWHCGSQTDTFLALYTTRTPIRGRRDVRTVFARYSVNDRLPGQTNAYPELGTVNGPMLFWDQGRKLGVHHKSTAMMLYKPRLYARKQVRSLRLMVLMPLSDGRPEEIWLGGRRLEGTEGEHTGLVPVCLKDGRTYMAFHPLVPVDHGRKRAVRVEEANGYLILSFYNYEGEERDFGAAEFALTGNGFVCELGSEAEDGSFAAFRERVGQGQVQVEDRYLSNVHMRGAMIRKSVYSRPGVRLACEYSPVSEGIRYMTVNGRQIGEIRLLADGLDAAQLPFLGEEDGEGGDGAAG